MPRRQSHADARAVYFESHMRVGFAVFAAESFAILLYLVTTPRGPHRVVLMAIAALAGVAASVSFFTVDYVARHTWQANYSLAWSLAGGWLLAYCAHLDGGIDSPMLYLILLPVVYGALGYQPTGVVACGGSALAQLVVISATDPDIALPRTNLFMTAAVVGGVSALAVAAAIYRARMERRQVLLLSDLEELADTDGLTGCLNHRAFHERLELELDRAARHHRPLSLILSDIDDFKSINDAFGHATGDQALVAVAETLRAELRSADVVGRIGGDEFGVLLPDTALDGAEIQARRIVERLRQQPSVAVSLSLGIACLDSAQPSAEQLYRDADRALYYVKNTGRQGIAATSSPGPPARIAS